MGQPTIRDGGVGQLMIRGGGVRWLIVWGGGMGQLTIRDGGVRWLTVLGWRDGSAYHQRWRSEVAYSHGVEGWVSVPSEVVE